MNENTKKERRAANLASLSSLALIIFAQLQDKYEFFHELPNLIVLLICVVCTLTSIWAASNLISNNKHVKVSLFQVSATSALAAVIALLNFRNLLWGVYMKKDFLYLALFIMGCQFIVTSLICTFIFEKLSFIAYGHAIADCGVYLYKFPLNVVLIIGSLMTFAGAAGMYYTFKSK